MREYSLEFPSRELAIELLCLDSLGEVDQKRVLDFVTYNGDFDPKLIAKAVGRNILFPLIESIGSLDTVQISGAGYFDFGITDNDGKQAILIPDSGSIRPPQEDTDRFTHTTTVVIGGETTSLVQQSPLGSYTEKAAREKFKEFLKSYPESSLVYNAKFWAAESSYHLKNYEEAILEYDDLLTKFPEGENAPTAMLKQGLAFLELGDKIDARLVLSRVRAKFPDTEQAKAAEAKLKEIK